MEPTFSQRREMENSGYNRPALHAVPWSWVMEQPLYYRCAQETITQRKGGGKNGQPRGFELRLKDLGRGGFPCGAVVESPPANAGDTGSSPGLGRSHMPRSNWAREPRLLSLRVWSLCSATREAAIVRGQRTAMKSGRHSPQLEKALAQKRRPNTVKKIFF